MLRGWARGLMSCWLAFLIFGLHSIWSTVKFLSRNQSQTTSKVCVTQNVQELVRHVGAASELGSGVICKSLQNTCIALNAYPNNDVLYSILQSRMYWNNLLRDIACRNSLSSNITPRTMNCAPLQALEQSSLPSSVCTRRELKN